MTIQANIKAASEARAKVKAVPRAIAQEIQRSAALRQSQVECDNIAKFSSELRSQIDF